MEKEITTQHEVVDEKHVTQVKTIRGTEAFNEAKLKEPPSAFNTRAFILYFSCLIGFFCSTANGYDGSLLNALLANNQFKEFFDVRNKGIWAGIVTSMYQIGSVVALPFVGPCIDTLGRRAGMFCGAAFIIAGTIVQGACIQTGSRDQFMGGRFLLGFGVSIASSAGPMYVVEVSHPAYRGVTTALYNTFWFTGSIIASGAARGALNLGGNSQWLVPVWLQLLFSGLIVIFCFFLPESPRWLFVNNKRDQCKKILAYYHGNGNEDSEWVKLQLREYEEYLEMNGADKRWWDYRALFRDRPSIYRIGCNIVISIYGQWAGNAVLSYFLSAVLDSAGITNETTQLNINLGLACLQFVVAMSGAACVDLLGRRFLLLFTNIGCSVIWIGMTVATSQFSETESSAAAKASLAMIYMFGIVYSFGFTPLQALYPVEVLSFEMRAKGMAFSSFSLNAAMLLNQFAWPVSLDRIGWKTYIVFVIWCAFQAITIYFFIPETRNRTLEELDDIFKSKNPRKASTEVKKLHLDAHGDVVDIHGA
ncbi:general substrate transporter [Lineolata rhizophorae]|uniref:General substrate transporter n=1 Tax=Lineolata rhizophorae TaxID=578093 RepID=A0A6A6P1E1_9PEZI|nr:general substrate transporter [Lineolata rhizophorae]